MKRFIILGISCCIASFLSADSMDIQESSPQESQVPSQNEVLLKIDPLSTELTQQGLDVNILQQTVAKELNDASIAINQNISFPALVLRVRSITSGLDIASFIQLSFQEEAMLVRNRSMHYATTWSQSSVLLCRPEDSKKEIVEIVSSLTKSFAKDYIKAVQPKPNL